MTIEEKLAFYQDRYDRLLDPDLWILSGTLFFGTKTEPKPKSMLSSPTYFFGPNVWLNFQLPDIRKT